MELSEVFRESLPFSWACYPSDVEIVNFQPQGYNQIGASGLCPQCGNKSYFRPVTPLYAEVQGNALKACSAVQCEVCKQFAIVIDQRAQNLQAPYSFVAFYPLGKPNDNVEPAVPKEISDDFREALRCRWVEAHKASVTMCRRSIQSSCLAQGANKKNKLVAQIDELATKGLITEPLRRFAHEVRLEGNDGAHPDPDGLDNVTQKDADDIIEFTREYLHHVYVMPAKLAARKALPPAAAKP